MELQAGHGGPELRRIRVQRCGLSGFDADVLQGDLQLLRICGGVHPPLGLFGSIGDVEERGS
eukprot:6492375-Amphidinium_carterae.1